MTATIPSAAIVPTELVFTEPEQIALAGFLASYSGLTRDAYMLDLRQFTNLVPPAQPAPVRGSSRRYRVLRRRPGSQRPGPVHRLSPPGHHRRTVQVRRRGRLARAFPGRACPAVAASKTDWLVRQSPVRPVRTVTKLPAEDLLPGVVGFPTAQGKVRAA